MKVRYYQLIILLFALATSAFDASASEAGKIRAVLFFSNSCPACHIVMEDILPPLVEEYPGVLDIVGIDVGHPVGADLYQSVLEIFAVPDEKIGVPTLIAGSTILVGSDEIRAQFPALVEISLAAGGLDWPEIPGLAQIIESQEVFSSTAPKPTAVQEEPAANKRPGFINKFLQDPIANAFAVFVLLGMLLSAAAVLISYLKGPDHKFIEFPEWSIFVLGVIGLAIAGYLSYVELSKTAAICGPVGNCNRVQESSYAFLFGIIPVGLLGVFGFLAILAGWFIKNFGPQTFARYCAIAIWGMSWFGVIFSIYLTFLEPFVIGATCLWCATSAIVMTMILVASTAQAKEALRISSELIDEDENDDILEKEEKHGG